MLDLVVFDCVAAAAYATVADRLLRSLVGVGLILILVLTLQIFIIVLIRVRRAVASVCPLPTLLTRLKRSDSGVFLGDVLQV